MAKDPAQTWTRPRQTADQEDAKALNQFGENHQKGLGVRKDFALAVLLFRRAADQGYAITQNHLCAMYQVGDGVARDDAQAVLCYRKAADQGEPHARYNLAMKYELGRGVARDKAQAASLYRMAADQGFAPARRNRDQLSRPPAVGRMPAPASPAAEAKPTPFAAPAAAHNTVFPKAVDAKYASECPGEARMHACLDQYNANVDNGSNGGMKWIPNYFTECNSRLFFQSQAGNSSDRKTSVTR